MTADERKDFCRHAASLCGADFFFFGADLEANDFAKTILIKARLEGFQILERDVDEVFQKWAFSAEYIYIYIYIYMYMYMYMYMLYIYISQWGYTDMLYMYMYM